MSGSKNNIIPTQLVDDSKIEDYSSIQKVTLITTKGCNMSCDYCFEKHFPEQKMKVEDAIRSIEKYDPSYVKFFGGEPLINRALVREIMDIYPDKKFEITTNGTYARKLGAKYWQQFDSINISLDGLYEKDKARWSWKNSKGEIIHDDRIYNKTIDAINYVHGLVAEDILIINVTTSPETLRSYTLTERVIDIHSLTGATRFDINVAVFDGDNNLVMNQDDREEFLRQTLELYYLSIREDGLWEITLNEAVFSTEDASNTCCAFASKTQAAIDVNGYEGNCHVAAYYNIPNKVLLEKAKTSNASCVMMEIIADKTNTELPLDKDNFVVISKAEEINNALYYIRTKNRVLCR